MGGSGIWRTVKQPVFRFNHEHPARWRANEASLNRVSAGVTSAAEPQFIAAFLSIDTGRDWSGRPDLNRGPPAPKSGVLSLGSPSFSISFLKTNELERYLVVARCTEMWLRMQGVPPISPSAKKQPNASDWFPPITET